MRHTFTPLEISAMALWTVAMLALIVFRALHPEKNNVLPTYEMAGRCWRLGEPIYVAKGGFVYSPLVAAFFAPFSMLPPGVSAILWLLLNTSLYLGAMAWWLRSGLHAITRLWQAALLIALLPLTLGNLHNGQINPMVIALIMLSILCARAGRWNLSALAISIAAYVKIYPLAIGLLLIAIYPRRLGWRIAVALLLLGAMSLFLQNPSYALDQYRQWWHARISDNRHGYDPSTTPRDLWKVLVVLGVPITGVIYKGLQMATAGALALLCLLAPRMGWTRARLLVGMFSLACCWMLLLGPASESATYVLLAPAISLALIHCLEHRVPARLRWGMIFSYFLFLLGLGINSFSGFHRLPLTMIVQPVAALVYLASLAFWLSNDKLWPRIAAKPAAAIPSPGVFIAQKSGVGSQVAPACGRLDG